MSARAGRRTLTRRERDIALLLAQGLGRRQIGVALGITVRAVARHERALKAKRPGAKPSDYSLISRASQAIGRTRWRQKASTKM